MTEWRARLGKRTTDLDTRGVAAEPAWRIVCGFGRDDHWCPEIIGWMVGDQSRTMIALPLGLTDAAREPGSFAWSATAAEKMAAGQRPAVPGHIRPLQSDEGIRYNLFAGPERPLPWRVPCRRNHVNLIDSAALSS